jgi:hypothetical protein
MQQPRRSEAPSRLSDPPNLRQNIFFKLGKLVRRQRTIPRANVQPSLHLLKVVDVIPLLSNESLKILFGHVCGLWQIPATSMKQLEWSRSLCSNSVSFVVRLSRSIKIFLNPREEHIVKAEKVPNAIDVETIPFQLSKKRHIKLNDQLHATFFQCKHYAQMRPQRKIHFFEQRSKNDLQLNSPDYHRLLLSSE